MPSFATTSLHDVGAIQARTVAVPPEFYPGGYVALTLHLSGPDERPVELNLYLPITHAAYAARVASAINGWMGVEAVVVWPNRRDAFGAFWHEG